MKLLGLDKSTFHYGSIKIEKVINPRTKAKISTFHYGSIKIRWALAMAKSQTDLHSTMVLLKSVPIKHYI